MKERTKAGGKTEKQKANSLRAEALLRLAAGGSQVAGRTLDEIFQELQVFQIELEMQNDELRLVNEDLELQRLRFAGIYELAPFGLFILDRSGLIIEVNTAGVELLRIDRKKIAGQPLYRFIGLEFTTEFHQFIHKLKTKGNKGRCRSKFRSGDGVEFDVQVEGLFIEAAAQFYIGVVDISETIAFKHQLNASNDRLQLAVEAAQASTWELDPETMKLEIDQFGRRFSKIAKNRFDGTYSTFLDLVHAEDRAAVDQAFRTAINKQTEINLSCRFFCPDIEVCHADIRGHMLQMADGRPIIAGIMTDQTDKIRLEAESQKLRRDRQKEINAAILIAEERERQQISDVLHDSVSQLLYGIKLKLSMLGPSAPAGLVREISTLLDEAVRETRNISYQLSPAILEDFGLIAALDELITRISTPSFRILTRVTGFKERIAPSAEIHIFRIVQELLNNCMKHSGASEVVIQLARTKNITIAVSDNGAGFKSGVDTPHGTGLSSIRNRISVYNGTMSINPRAGGGTVVRVELFYDQ